MGIWNGCSCDTKPLRFFTAPSNDIAFLEEWPIGLKPGTTIQHWKSTWNLVTAWAKERNIRVSLCFFRLVELWSQIPVSVTLHDVTLKKGSCWWETPWCCFKKVEVDWYRTTKIRPMWNNGKLVGCGWWFIHVLGRSPKSENVFQKSFLIQKWANQQVLI